MPGSSPLGQVPQGVEALLAELQARFPESAAPHASLFEGFLRKVILEQQSPTALRLLQGRVVLGGAAVRALGTSPGRAQLLSALYSVFNRQHPEVADLDERKFHALLVASLRPGLG